MPCGNAPDLIDQRRRRGATIAPPDFDHVNSGIQAQPRVVLWFRGIE